MSRLKRLSRVAMSSMKGELPEGMQALIGDVVVTIVEQMFYICAIDTRVRSTYSIAQLCLSLRENISLFSEEQQDLVAHVIMDQSLALLRAMRSREEIGRASCRERVGQDVEIPVGGGPLKKKK